MRAGAFALSLLSTPFNLDVLKALGEESSMSLMELRQAVDGPPPTTMRGHLQTLTSVGVIIRRRQDGFPGTVEYELGGGAAGLLEVGRLLQEWLDDAPERPSLLGDDMAKSTLKALTGGWNAMILRVIAARPLSLTALSRLLTKFNYPSLERRLVAMRMCGLIEARPSEGRGTPYGPTEWMRSAAGPLLVAAQWERHSAAAEVVPIGHLEVETALLLAAPTISLPPNAAGSCRLGIEVDTGSGETSLAGVQLQVTEDKVFSRATRLEGQADSSATGSPSAWVRALASGEIEDLALTGESHLATEIVKALHGALFQARQHA